MKVTESENLRFFLAAGILPVGCAHSVCNPRAKKGYSDRGGLHRNDRKYPGSDSVSDPPV